VKVKETHTKDACCFVRGRWTMTNRKREENREQEKTELV